MLCKNCNKEIADGSKFCKYCGASAEKIVIEIKEMFCKACGNKLEDDALFCKLCGAAVKTDGGGSVKTEKRFFTKKKLLIAVAVVVCLVAAVILLGEDGESRVEPHEPLSSAETYSPIDGGTSASNSNKAVNVDGIYYKLIDTRLVLSGQGELDKSTINSFSKKSFDTVEFESGSIDIPENAFSGYSNIKNVELNNVVGRIGAEAFKGCGLDFLLVDGTVSQIGDDAFADCNITCVYLNNPEIRANLNTRYDFGRLFENATEIIIHYATGNSQAPDDDFTLAESAWGDYLRNNEQYSRLKSIVETSATLASQHYNLWANALDYTRISFVDPDTGEEKEYNFPKDNVCYSFEY